MTQSSPPSKDLDELNRLLSHGYRLEGIKTQFGAPDTEGNVDVVVTLTLVLESETRELTSGEDDVVAYSQNLYAARDKRGNPRFRRFADSNRYWLEMEELGRDPDERRKVATTRLANGSFRFDYDPKDLLIDYLTSARWADARFLPLKRDHYEFDVLLTVECKRRMDAARELYKAHPLAKAHGELIARILDGAWQKEESFLKRSMHFLRFARFDVDGAIRRAGEQVRHAAQVRRLIAAATPVSARDGLPLVLDTYRRYGEAVRPFIAALGDAVRHAAGKDPLDPSASYEVQVAALRESPYSTLVRSLEPQIRHSESHGGTEYDDAARVVHFTAPDEGKGRRARASIRKTLTYDQVCDMTNELENGLLLALLTEFATFDAGVLLVLLRSPEYLRLLLSIDNLS